MKIYEESQVPTNQFVEMKNIQLKKMIDLETIIINKSIKSVFQPIVSLTDGTVLGYEALSRVEGEYSINSPDELFHTKGNTIPEDMKVTDLWDYLNKMSDIPGVCVLSKHKVMGIITRENLQKLLSGLYSFSLNQNRKAADIMDQSFLSVDSLTSISTVSSMAMKRHRRSLYDFVVVTENDNYLGIVTIKDLLMKSTEISIDMAKTLNPLSGLPVNIVIFNEMERLLHNKFEYTAMYLDMDNFKAFNDVYGFERGDDVIKILATILKNLLEKMDSLVISVGMILLLFYIIMNIRNLWNSSKVNSKKNHMHYIQKKIEKKNTFKPLTDMAK